METIVPGTALLALNMGGALAEIASEIANDPELYTDRGFPATADDLDAVALIVREQPDLNTKEAVSKLLDLFAWHRLTSIPFVRDLVRDHGIERISFVLDLLFATGIHAHRDQQLENAQYQYSSKKYDPTTGITELIDLLDEMADIDPDFEVTEETLGDIAERAGGMKALLCLSGPELAKVMRQEDDVDEAELPVDAVLRHDRDQIDQAFDDDPADVRHRLQVPVHLSVDDDDDDQATQQQLSAPGRRHTRW
jgi:hypothetical protein